MNPFEMVVAIVFIGVVGGVLSTAFKSLGHKKDGRAARAASADEQREADELRDQIVTLEDRIEVLERIITDTSSRDDLRRQFRDLER